MLTIGLIIFISSFAYSQETFSSKVWAFAIQKPKDWETITKSYRDENIDKFEFSEKAQKLIMESDKGFSFLTGYRKYNPETHEGLIPGIQVAVRKKGPSAFATFKEQILKSSNDFKKELKDFKVIEETEVEISGKKALKAIYTFTVAMTDGQVLKARSRMYWIPRETYFFQVSFNDGIDPEVDCSVEFDALVKTISITR